MNVLGLDLSLVATGIAVSESRTYVLRPRALGDARLAEIDGRLAEVLANGALGSGQGAWDLAVVEDLVKGFRNAAAGDLGMVHGVVRLALMRAGVPYVLVPPASLKRYATGHGNATKADMRMALFQRTGVDERQDGAVDAWWLWAMGKDAAGEAPLALPATCRQALAKVCWPEWVKGS